VRILLISPDRKGIVQERQRGKQRLRGTFPPLSLLQVAALTPPEHEVILQDEAVQELDLGAACDVVGITALTSSAPRAYDVADAFRARGIPVVIGGMHASACAEEALEHCDAVVVGEAEGKWPRLLTDLERGELQSIYRDGGFPHLETVPPPRRELMRRSDYIVPDTLQATRGCTHSCSYCSVSTFFGHQVRTRPVQAVAEEVASLPGKVVAFVDDNIMARPGYAAQLFKALSGMGKKWFAQASTAVLQNAELVKLAGRSGCQLIFIGLETLSSKALSQVNKRFNVVSRFQDTIKRLHDAGIGVVGAFMFGFDGEDESVFERTAAFADRARIDLPQYSILTPLPGTPLYAQMEAEQRIIDRDWSKYDGGHAVFLPRGTTPERLEEGLKSALKHSYSRLGILRRLLGLSARLPLMLALNLAFRRRAIPFAMGPAR
jgi:radical SAM superfamily enzyme YgiQ (UPF0313 family)